MDRRQDEEPQVADLGEREDRAVPTRRRALVLTALVAVVVLVAAGIAFALGGGDASRRVVVGRDVLAVRAALDATTESGGYEIRFETESTGTAVGTQTVDGHGTLNVRPYALATVADVSHIGPILVRTDGVSIWEHGGADYGLTPDGSEGAGQSLSGFAGLVQSTIGQGPGAVSMLNLASPTGYLALAAPSVTSATADGTGSVDGAPVTYYVAKVDLRRLADLPDLGPEQHRTIANAAGALDRAGYDGTDVRIAIDASGYVVETTAQTVFGDGSRFRTHTVLSHFGCVGRVVMPDASSVAPAVTDGCSTATTTSAPVASSSTTSSSTSSTSTTTVAPVVTTTSAGTTTTAAGSTSVLTRIDGAGR